LSNHLMNLRSNGNRYYLYFTLYNIVTGADGEPLQGIQVTFVKPNE